MNRRGRKLLARFRAEGGVIHTPNSRVERNKISRAVVEIRQKYGPGAVLTGNRRYTLSPFLMVGYEMLISNPLVEINGKGKRKSNRMDWLIGICLFAGALAIGGLIAIVLQVGK